MGGGGGGGGGREGGREGEEEEVERVQWSEGSYHGIHVVVRLKRRLCGFVVVCLQWDEHLLSNHSSLNKQT